MKVDELQREFRVLSQTSDSLKKSSFENYEIDEYLYKGIVQFVKNNYSFSYSTNKGFEVDQSRIDKLASIVINSPELQPAISPTQVVNGVYEVNLDQLGNNITGVGDYYRYLYFIKAYANCTKVCGNKTVNKRIRLGVFKSNESVDYHNQSSWYWSKVRGYFGKSRSATFTSLDTESNNNDQLSDLIVNGKYSNDSLTSLFINTNDVDGNSEFEIESVEISYVKYPNKPYSGGYQHIDGRNIDINKQVHCDISDIFAQEIVRYAVNLAANDVTNVANIQIRGTQIQNDLIN
jgi:hypothetical protein